MAWQDLSYLSGKGNCGCKMTTYDKTSDDSADAAIRLADHTFDNQVNNTVYCYQYEIPDLVPVRASQPYCLRLTDPDLDCRTGGQSSA